MFVIHVIHIRQKRRAGNRVMSDPKNKFEKRIESQVIWGEAAKIVLK